MRNREWIVVDGPSESVAETSEGLVFTVLGGLETTERVSIARPLQRTLEEGDTRGECECGKPGSGLGAFADLQLHSQLVSLKLAG